MKEEQIEHLLGTTVYRRALSYYREGRVIASYSEEGIIDAIVRGSNDNRYKVRIVFDERGNFKEATCNCPYPYYCKHIGAVLLKFLEDREIYPSIKARNFELPEKRGIAKKHEDEVILLDSDEVRIGQKLSDELFSEVFRYGLGKGGSYNWSRGSLEKQRFKLVFVLEEGWSSLGEDESLSGWVVKPYLRYVRKDGSLGRFESFRPDRLDFPVPENERELLSLLLSGDTEKSIDYYIELFLPDEKNFSGAQKYGRLDLYIKGMTGFKPAKFRKIEKTVVTFSFSSLRLEGTEKVPYFEPVFNFYDTEGSVTSVKAPLKISMVSRYFFVVESSGGNILYLIPDLATIPYRRLVSRLLLRDIKYSYSMIVDLKDFISSHSSDFSNMLEVCFPVKRIRLTYISPRPVLDIRPKFMSLELRLLFKYGDRIVDYPDSAELLIIEEGGEELVVAVRGKEYERRWIYFLRDYLDSDVGGNENVIVPGSVEDFLLKHGERLLEEGFELRKRGKRIGSASGIRLFAEGSIDWLDVRVELDTETGERVVVNPVTDRVEGLFLRKGDSYYLLKREDIERLKTLFLHGDLKGESVRIPISNLGIIDELYEDFVNKESETLLRLKTLIDKLKSFNGIQRIPPARGFKGRLRSYQQEGLDWLYFLYKYGINGILADDMGLGKTIQVLALFSVLKEHMELRNVLIVTPVSTLSNWVEEIKRFTPGLTFYVHYGQKRLREVNGIKNNDITLISYQTLRNDIGILKNFSFNYLVMDEAQIAKNPLSKVYKALRLVRAEHKLALTGTPVENTTVDLWAQMNLLNPGVLGGLSDFKEEFAKPIERDGDKEKSELLRRMVRFFILRREKESVLKELPPKEELILYATMDTRQRELYERVKNFYRGKVLEKLEREGINKSSMVIFEALLRLRQIAILPSLVSGEYSDIPACKVDLLKLKIGEILSSNHKLLIFSQFKGSLSIIREWLDSIGVRYSYLDGGTKNREGEIKAFQEEANRRVFIISLKAGGLGINLTAADYVIIFDPWWNPAVETQAIDRSHRIGQVNRVIIYKLITKDTIEEKIIELQRKKGALVKGIVTSENMFFKSLSPDEIASLFDVSG